MVALSGTAGKHTRHEAVRRSVSDRCSNGVSPEASNDLQAPSGESMPSFWNCSVVCGLRQTLVPPTMAASHWPARMARRAWSRASKLDEHAVSTAKLGPATEREHCETSPTPNLGSESENRGQLNRGVEPGQMVSISKYRGIGVELVKYRGIDRRRDGSFLTLFLDTVADSSIGFSIQRLLILFFLI